MPAAVEEQNGLAQSWSLLRVGVGPRTGPPARGGLARPSQHPEKSFLHSRKFACIKGVSKCQQDIPLIQAIMFLNQETGSLDVVLPGEALTVCHVSSRCLHPRDYVRVVYLPGRGIQSTNNGKTKWKRAVAGETNVEKKGKDNPSQYTTNSVSYACDNFPCVRGGGGGLGLSVFVRACVASACVSVCMCVFVVVE